MEYFDINNIEIKKRIIVENNLAFAFPTNTPIVPGHTLICPKRNVSRIEELKEEEIRAIFYLQSKLKKAMIKAFGAEGFNYAWNDGKIAGQNINHFHLHMLPRKKGDSGIFEYEPRKFLYRPGERPISQEKELIEVARLIQKNI
jgi:diadenosine tetraphosphate (Ap4A) HIT family hydrolase